MSRYPVPACLAPYDPARVWVAWNMVRTEGRMLKVPYAPGVGTAASVSNPATWGTLDAARRLATVRAYRGIGIVSAGVPALVFIDLDRCIDPATGEPTNDDAARLLADCGNTYAERTPSGTGVRIIGTAPHIDATVSRKGDTPGGLALEIYKGAARYLTVTGARCPAHPDALADIGDAVLDLLPLLGRVDSAETGADGREDAELVRRIVTGTGFHAELCALAARYLGRGMSAEASAETLRGLMLAHPEAARDDRWRDRFSSITGLVTSAAAKFEASPENRRALARLACNLVRSRRPMGDVTAEVMAEAAVLGIATDRAAGIVRWAAVRELERRGVPHDSQ